MVKLVVVTGLAGSGKTAHLPEFQEEYGATCRRDSFMKNSFRHKEPIPCSRHFVDMICELRNGRNCIITDSAFCKVGSREELEGIVRELVSAVVFVWIAFDNNPEQCRLNVIASGRKVEERLANIKKYKDVYTYPKGAVRVRVGDGSNSLPLPENVEGLDLDD